MTFGQPAVSASQTGQPNATSYVSTHRPRTFVCRAIRRIVTALDACPVRGRLYKLDVVLVSQALTALGVALPAGSTARIVLATLILGIQPGQVAGPDASCHC